MAVDINKVKQRMNKSKFSPDILFSIHAQAKILHLQTTSYAEHNAFGGFYDDLDDLIDQFIECWQGKYGRVNVGGSLSVQNYEAGESMSFADNVLAYLNSLQNDCPDSELKNILDEMKALADRLKYLLTLK